MQDTTSDEKSNSPKREWNYPRAVEVFYPRKIGSVEDRYNWIAAMILDSRLGDRDKVILTRLALHLNLQTGRLDPSMDLLALETSLGPNQESGRRVARRCIARAEELGWIERTGRHAGYRFNRSNSYRLRIPKDIHPDKFNWSSGQKQPSDRTPESPRIGNVNREQIYRKGTFDKGRGTSIGYTQKDLSLVRDILAKKPLQVDRVVERAAKLGAGIDSHALCQTVVDGEIEFDRGFVRANPAHHVSADQLSRSEGSEEMKP